MRPALAGRTAAVTLALALACAIPALAGCGVPAEPTAREIGSPTAAYQSGTTATPSVDESGAVPVTLFLVRDDLLVSVVRWVPSRPTLDELVEDLATGPTSAERASGLTSALLGTDVVGQVRLAGTLATVRLSAEPESGRNDEVLALGQLVCTLDAYPGVDGVSFVRDGQEVSVPRGDGTLSSGPLTSIDYAGLIVVSDR